LNPAWRPFLDSISRAEQEYDAVSSKSCYRDLTTDCTVCHDNVIINDLAPFQDAGGISAAMMESASQIKRITKYQIINHKLYRSENCMFPFRLIRTFK
jgi:protein glucosyltransferase